MKSIRRILQVLTCLVAAFYLYAALTRFPDFDELQTLLNSACLVRGERLYVDFWDNHGPMATWMFAPLLAVCKSTVGSIVASRMLVYLIIAGNAWLVFLISRATQASIRTAWIALLLFLLSPLLIFKGVEIRPDNFALTAFLGALYFLLRSLHHKNVTPMVLAGICFGIMAALTLKAVLHAGVFVAISIVGGFTLKRHLSLKQWLGITVAGALATCAWLGLTALTTRFDAFWICYVEGNASRENYHSPSRFYDFFKSSLPWMLFATIATIVQLKQLIRTKRPSLELGFSLGAWILCFQFAFLLPTKYYQTLLSTIPLFAVASAPLLDRILGYLEKAPPGRTRSWQTALVVLILLLNFRSMWSFGHMKDSGLLTYARTADAWLDKASDSPAVFDMTGWLYQKRHVGQYQAIVRFLLTAHRNGAIDLEIPTLLDSSQVQFMVWDDRAASLPEEDRSYIRQNYVPLTHSIADEMTLMAHKSYLGNLSSETIQPATWWNEQPRPKPRKQPLPESAEPKWFTQLKAIYEEERQQ